jgi:5-methylcytosine-specific restriction endonuclease McrA
MTKKQRQEVLNKFGGKCAYCGQPLPATGWHVDHAMPVERIYESVRVEGKHGGLGWADVCRGMRYPERDCFENWMPACASCNINKHGDTLEQFRANIAGYLRSLNLRMVQYKIAKRYGLVEETGKPVIFYFESLK